MTEIPIARPSDADTPEVPPVRGPLIAGAVIIVAFFGVFGLWSGFAPLESAAIAPGTVSAEGSRRTVQHLEGGIVDTILVRDGDAVEEGALLVRMQET